MNFLTFGVEDIDAFKAHLIAEEGYPLQGCG